MHYFNVQLTGKNDALVEGQVVQAHFGATLAETLEEIYDLNLDGRLRAEMLIVRLPVEENWDPALVATPNTNAVRMRFGGSVEERKQVFIRAQDRSVHVMGSHNAQPFLTPNLSPHWSSDPLSSYGLNPDSVLKAIQAAEIEHILNCSHAVLSLPRGSKYLAPSRRIVQSFIRVGNIQYDRDAIDAISYWLLPHLVNVGAILTDTWSISSIALSASKLCAAYFGGKAPPVEMLPTYNDGSEVAVQKTRRIVERLAQDAISAGSTGRAMLCLISATQTGSLATHLKRIFETSDIPLTPRFVTLFRLGSSSLSTLHDLSQDSRFALQPDAETATERPSAPIRIDPQIYFPLTFQDAIVVLDKRAADHCRPFFQRYIGSGLIQVHCDHQEEGSKPQHHAVHLATEILLQVPAFVTAFEARLAQIPSPPLFIVTPPHEAGRSLGRHAQAYFDVKGHRCPLFVHPHLRIPDNPLREDERLLRNYLREAGEDQSILIIDDVCITGTRLSQYQRYIRTEHYRGRIDYLVAIARPADMSVWSYYERYLGFRSGNSCRHTVAAVEQVLLPDWRQRQCPWCAEKRLYETWLDRLHSLPAVLMERLEKLSCSMRTGLVGDLFLQLPGAIPFRLGPDSLFAPEGATQAEVFAALASAIQYLRTTAVSDRPLLGPRRFPISTVLAHADYCRAKWTDSILRASILRAASPEELTYSDAELEEARASALRSLITQPADGEHEISLELLLAANQEKCSLELTAELRDQLKTFGAPDVVEYMLDRMAQLEPRY